MNARINRWLWIGFAAIWTILVVISYWSFHPSYSVAFGDIPNAGMIITLLLVTAGGWYFTVRSKMKVNGLKIYSFLLLLQMLVFALYASSKNIFEDGLAPHVTYFVAFNIFLHAAVGLIIIVHYALGELVTRHFASYITPASLPMISVAVGICISGFILTILGIFGLLLGWLLWIVAASILIVQHKKVLEWLKMIFLKPMAPPAESKWSTVPIFLMFIAMAVNNVGIIQAFPVGFDGAGLYMNTTHLIAQSHALPMVGQAFNWELFMSLGELMFGLVPVSILLSHLAIVLVMLTLYRIGRLFMNKSASWLAVALLYMNPAFAFHAGLDSKIDLGFLFIVLGAVLLMAEYYLHSADQKNTEPLRIQIGGITIPISTLVWLVLGWMCGYAFGVKYTALFVIVAMLTNYFYKEYGFKLAVSILLLGIGSLFIAGIDRFAYLDLGGTPAWIIGILACITGVIFFIWGIRTNNQSVAGIWKIPAIFFTGILLAFAPWMGKHLSENNNFSISGLVQGKKGVPVLVQKSTTASANKKTLLQEEKIIASITSLGVTFTEPQLLNAKSVIATFNIVEADPNGRLNILLQARNTIIEQVLTEDQRQLVNSQLSNAGQDANMIREDREDAVALLIRIFDRRGIELSEEQLSKAREILDNAILQGIQIKGNREWATSFKKEVLKNVLTEEQRAVMSGNRNETASTGKQGGRPPAYSLAEVQREEIQRYMGYESGLPLYLSFPYDITMNTNVSFSRYLDISFLLLLLLPFIFWTGNLIRNSFIIGVSLFVWIISVYSLYAHQDVTTWNAFEMLLKSQIGNHVGFISTMVIPLFESVQWLGYRAGDSIKELYTLIGGIRYMWIFIAILLTAGCSWWLLRSKLHALPGPVRFLLAFMLAFGIQWFLFGNAIIWYGFSLFAILFLFIAYVAYHPEQLIPESLSGIFGKWWQSGVGLSLVLGLSLFFVSGIHEQNQAEYLYQKPFLQYASQRQSLKETQARFVPYMADVIATINADPTSKVYRVGTFFHYHIARNDRRVLEDNQLGVFAQITEKLEDKQDFIRILKESGFKFILFDINTAAIDKTPEKSLTRKANEFYLTLSNSTLVRPLFTDNFIKDPSIPFTKVGDINVPGRPGMGGEATMIGHYILFEIL